MLAMILQASTVFLVLFLIWSSPSTLLVSSEIYAIPSEYAVPTNTTTSWMPNQLQPSLWLNGTTCYHPILLSNSSSSGSLFSSGFYCDVYNTSCFFGTILFKNSSMDLNYPEINILDGSTLVWSANQNDPIEGNAILNFTSKGDLLLATGKGNLVWSSNTSGKSVSGLKLTELGNLVLFGKDRFILWQSKTELGNLVLFGKDRSILWQSFDYPTVTLVRGQNFFPGQKLIANQGLYSLTNEKNKSIVAYIGSNPPQVYYNFTINFTDDIYNSLRIEEQNASFNLSYQFSKLEANGHFNIYQFGPIGPQIMVDLLKHQINDCDHPMACGRYGLCSGSNQCSCPEEVKNGNSILRPLDYREPDLGCTLLTNISCYDTQYHSLVELKKTTLTSTNTKEM